MNQIFTMDSHRLHCFTHVIAVLLFLCCASSINAQITYSASVSHVSCADLDDGAVTLNVSGGSGAYEVFWPDIALTGLTQTNLAAGTYKFSISDMTTNEFLPDQEVTITEPEKLVVNILELSQATFVGACDAIAILDITGGIAPYTVEWTDGNPVGNGQTVEALCAGSVTATVRDANLCEEFFAITVEDLSQAMAVGFNVNNVSCNGASDGSITVNVNGGTGAHEVVWSDSDLNSDIRFELSAGIYYALVNDVGTGQIVELEIEVQEPEPMSTDADWTMPSGDEACDGSVSELNIAGGTAPYEVDWMGQDPSALCYGSYEISVTDANLCTEILTVTVGQTTGIADISTQNWSAYPNPVQSNGIINVDFKQIEGPELVSLIDLSGKTVYRQNVDDAYNTQIALDGLSPGLYFISVQTNRNQFGLKKIVIK